MANIFSSNWKEPKNTPAYLSRQINRVYSGMPFTFEHVDIDGLVIIRPKVFGDSRGFFFESYKKTEFVTNGIHELFVQDNHSLSSRGVLRGLHFQIPPMEQGKLVRVVTGKIWDVAVDIRSGSPTYKQWFGVELSAENRTMFYIPPGFAHGFVTLEDETNFLYKCTKEYSPYHERGIKYDDIDIAVQWPMTEVVMSQRDQELPTFVEIEEFLL